MSDSAAVVVVVVWVVSSIQLRHSQTPSQSNNDLIKDTMTVHAVGLHWITDTDLVKTSCITNGAKK